MATLYDLKPAFQRRLRPLASRLAASGVTANQVTLAAAALSVATGVILATWPHERALFWFMPVVLFARMALNAIDGMLAREHGQASTLGMYLNELCDLVSDVALILPFALVPPFAPWSVVGFAFAAVLSECAGILGIPAGAGRVYTGPFGKSDRALALGAVAVLGATGLSGLFSWLFPVLALLSAFTTVNRVRAGIAATSRTPDRAP